MKSACRLALEGIVSKRLDAPYRSGRTNSWTPQLTAQTLMRLTPRLPAGWAEQRKLLGFR